MMRDFRLLAYFFIGFLIASYAVLAHAETIPATYGKESAGTPKWAWRATPPIITGDSGTAVCDAIYARYNNTNPHRFNDAGWGSGGCQSKPPEYTNWLDDYTMSRNYCPAGYNLEGTYPNDMCNKPTAWYCPSGQNWTLNGQTCTRPDCVAPQTRDSATGLCKSPACPPDKPTQKADGTCIDVCAAYLGQEGYEGAWIYPDEFKDYCQDFGTQKCLFKKSRVAKDSGYECLGVFCYRSSDIWSVGGGACAVGTPKAVRTTAPNNPEKTPPCAAGEGVMTSSSGKVSCVPAGTPAPATTPKVDVTKKTDTYGDGSTKTTETTKTTDPGTGANAVSVNVTVTAPPGGGTGQAGTPGATSSNTSNTSKTTGATGGAGTGGAGTPNEAGCDPAKDMCGNPGTNDLYKKKDKTVQSVLSTFSDGLKGSPIGTAMTGFFNISTRTGNCPSWVIPADYLGTSVNIGQYFCSTAAITMMDLAGAVILCFASFVAFRWAIL